MADRPGQQLEARWREKLEVRPQDQNQVISLLGGATLNFQAMGQLDAREIHFWLHESPPENPASPSGRGAGGEGFQPDRLLAEGNVVGNSPQFSTKVQRLEVWFSTAPRRQPRAELPAAGASEPYVPSTSDPSPASGRGEQSGNRLPQGRSRRWAGKIRRRPAAGKPTWKSAAACCRPACSCATSSMAT